MPEVQTRGWGAQRGLVLVKDALGLALGAAETERTRLATEAELARAITSQTSNTVGFSLQSQGLTKSC